MLDGVAGDALTPGILGLGLGAAAKLSAAPGASPDGWKATLKGRVDRQRVLALEDAPPDFAVDDRFFFQRACSRKAGLLAVAGLLPQVACEAVAGRSRAGGGR
jgi:hypothetical protein